MKALEEYCSISLGILIWSRACVVFEKVLCGMQCKAMLAVSAKRKNNEGRMMKNLRIKQGGVDVKVCLGSHVWRYECEG